MKHREEAAYFLQSSRYLLRPRMIHIIITTIEILITFFHFLDFFSKDYVLLSFITTQNNRTIQLLIFIIISLLSFSTFFFLTRKKNFEFLSYLFVNYYELFHLRVLSIIYLRFLIQSALQLYFIVPIFLVYTIIITNHFSNYHLYYYAPQSIFNAYPYDYFSSYIDIIHFIIKGLITFSYKVKEHFAFFIFFILCLLFSCSICGIYLMLFRPFFIMPNVVLNKIRISFVISLTLVFVLVVLSKNENVYNPKMILLYVNVTIIVLIIIFVKYEPYFNIKIKEGKEHYENNLIYKFFCDEKKKEMFSMLFRNMSFDKKKLVNNDYFHIIEKVFEIKNQPGNNNGNTHFIQLLITKAMKKLKKKKEYVLYHNLSAINELLLSELAVKEKTLKNNHESIKNFIEEIKLIEITNSFLLDFGKILKEIQKLICPFSKIYAEYNDYIRLSNSLANLKSKKYYQIIKPKNRNYSYTISTICFEELFNVSISQGEIQIRNDISQFEEIMTNYFEKNSDITMTIKIDDFSSKIIQIGKNLIHFLNSSFFDLFPNFVKTSQKMEMLKNIMKNEKNFQKFYFVISNKGEYLIMKLNTFIVFTGNEIILHGVYSLDKNTFISRSSNEEKSEFIFGVCNSNLRFSRNMLINDFLQVNNLLNKKISKIFEITKSNFNTYTIYKIKNESHSLYKRSIYCNKISEKSEISTSIKEENKYNMMNTVAQNLLESASSVHLSQTSKSSLENAMKKMSLKMRRKVKNQNNKHNFFLFQKFVFFLIFSSIFVSILDVIYKNKEKNVLFSNYSIFTSLRNLNRLYYHMVSSIISCTCLSIKGEQCINYLNLYSERFNSVFTNISLNFTEFIHRENVIKVTDIVSRSSTLANNIFAFNDKATNNAFNNEFPFSQITIKDNKINVVKSIISFNEMIKVIVNSFNVILFDDRYLYKPVYVISIPNNDFSNVEKNIPNIENWQIEFYNMILNYNKVCKFWESIQNALNDKINNQLLSFRTLEIEFFVSLSLINIIIFVIMVIYLTFFNKVITGIINSIRIKCFENDREIGGVNSFNEAFTKKISILQELISLYQKNPVELCENLTSLYAKYKRKESEKSKKDKAHSQNDTVINSSLKIISANILTFTTQKQLHNSFILKFLILFFILIYSIFLIMWITSLSNCLEIFRIINESSIAESSGYRDFTLYQLMIYTNQTSTELSTWMSTDKSIAVSLIGSLETLLTLNKSMKKLKHLIQFLALRFTLNCSDFYVKSKERRFGMMNNAYPEKNYFENLKKFCDITRVMEYDDNTLVYMQHYDGVFSGMQSINDYSVEGMHNLLMKDDFFYTSMFNYLIFRPVRTVENYYVFEEAVNNVVGMIKRYFIANAIVFFLYEGVLLIFFCLAFVYSVEKKFKNVIRMKHIFQLEKID